MRIEPLSAASIATVAADALVVGVYADEALSPAVARLDEALEGAISRLMKSGDITGKSYEVFPCWGGAGVATPLTVVVGLGEQRLFTRQIAFRVAGAASKYIASKQRARVACFLDDGRGAEFSESLVAGFIVGCQGQDLYRARKNRFPIEHLMWASGSHAGVESGQIVGESINLARRMVNEPPQVIYPETFAQEATRIASESNLQIEVWDQDRLATERCGSLLAVGKGSDRAARLVILRSMHGDPDAPLLALVGKGVTFDSGGLSLKPTDSMRTMKCDMAGGGAVLGAMSAIGRLQLPINVVGLVGLVENMTGGSAMKVGDVLHARNGRTIECLNTDAEGRLVLADVLDVAVGLGAAKIVDLATLTGACVVALGADVAGLMTNDQPWRHEVAAAAERFGELLWELPMFPEYADQIKSEVADIKNVGDGRWGGAITAAKFLEEFVARRPWVHLDIAGPAFLDKPKPWIDAGGSGAFVGTLVELARRWPGQAVPA